MIWVPPDVDFSQDQESVFGISISVQMMEKNACSPPHPAEMALPIVHLKKTVKLWKKFSMEEVYEMHILVK